MMQIDKPEFVDLQASLHHDSLNGFTVRHRFCQRFSHFESAFSITSLCLSIAAIGIQSQLFYTSLSQAAHQFPDSLRSIPEPLIIRKEHGHLEVCLSVFIQQPIDAEPADRCVFI